MSIGRPTGTRIEAALADRASKDGYLKAEWTDVGVAHNRITITAYMRVRDGDVWHGYHVEVDLDELGQVIDAARAARSPMAGRG